MLEPPGTPTCAQGPIGDAKCCHTVQVAGAPLPITSKVEPPPAPPNLTFKQLWEDLPCMGRFSTHGKTSHIFASKRAPKRNHVHAIYKRGKRLDKLFKNCSNQIVYIYFNQIRLHFHTVAFPKWNVSIIGPSQPQVRSGMPKPTQYMPRPRANASLQTSKPCLRKFP